MISFIAYLQKNKDQKPTGNRIQSFFPTSVPTPSIGITSNDNDQAIGDITGGEGGTIPDAEDEEMSMLQSLFRHVQAEDEEHTLELNDNTNDEDDTELGLDDTEGSDNEGSDTTDTTSDDLPDTNDVTADNTSENPDKQGMIRKIPNAHLVYKRADETGTFTELWMYEIKKGMRDEFNVRDNILAGTDIPPRQTSSPDGSQSYDMWTAGNMQLIQISGLPN